MTVFGSLPIASQTGWTLTLSASITRAGIWREVLEFVRFPLPLLRVGRGRFFDRNIWPDFRVFRIQRQPFLNDARISPRVMRGRAVRPAAGRHKETAPARNCTEAALIQT